MKRTFLFNMCRAEIWMQVFWQVMAEWLVEILHERMRRWRVYITYRYADRKKYLNTSLKIAARKTFCPLHWTRARTVCILGRRGCATTLFSPAKHEVIRWKHHKQEVRFAHTRMHAFCAISISFFIIFCSDLSRNSLFFSSNSSSKWLRYICRRILL